MKVRVFGDVCLAGEPEKVLSTDAGSLWDKLPIERSPRDVLIANVENAFCEAGQPRPYKWANLRAAPVSARLLRGLDVGVIANNHVGDFGEIGMRETLETLNHNGIATVGYGENIEAACRPLIIEREGVKLAVLAQCCPTTNGENYATHTHEGVAMLSVKLLRDNIAAARSQADAVLVYLHWGCERIHEAVPEQVRIGRLAVKFGADAVVGCHGHVIQSYECYDRRWVFHGLGNFLFGAVTFQAVSHQREVVTGRHDQLFSNQESLVADFELLDARPGERLHLTCLQPFRFGADFVPRPIGWKELTFNLNAVNRQLARYTAVHASALQSEHEPVFRAEVRNGILAYWYSHSPIRRSLRERGLRKVLRLAKHLSGWRRFQASSRAAEQTGATESR
ncbi:MAG: CapA family protein [Candidatus Acidiferrum sp.]